MANVIDWKKILHDRFKFFAADHSYPEYFDNVFLVSLSCYCFLNVYFKSEFTVFSWAPNTIGVLVGAIEIFPKI